MNLKYYLKQREYDEAFMELQESKTNPESAKMRALMNSSKPKIILLVGPPGSGKSTFVNYFLKSNKATVCSTDNIIEQKAKEMGLTYSQAFSKIDFKAIDSQFRAQIRSAGKKSENIIVDRTNMTDKSRASIMNLVPKSYESYAIVFWPKPEVLKQRLDKRAKETGKIIPDKVLNNMLASYIPPSAVEGFTDIIFIKQ